MPSASARTTAAPLPAQPAPAPLAAPAMVAGVDLAEAVRPPDALLRALRPELLRPDPARAELLWAEDRPMGPPPAFSANVLDLLPDSLTPPEDGDTEAAPTPTAPEGEDRAAEAADPAPQTGKGYAAPAAAPQLDRWL